VSNANASPSLSEDQQTAVAAATLFIAQKAPVLSIGGYAGSGKTTLIKHIMKQSPGALVCTFTGKATNVLRSKGIPRAGTIHSSIYEYRMKIKANKKTGRLQEDSDIDISGGFKLKKKLMVNEKKAKYIIIDEAQTVPTNLWLDIQTFDLPIILIGDPGQLEPVGDNPELMEHPDIMLTEIHRQGENSGIIDIATHIRNGGELDNAPTGNGVEIFHGKREDTLDWLCKSDDSVMLCGFNRTRVAANIQMRNHLGFTTDWINVGEQIICTSNDAANQFFNGQCWKINHIDRQQDDQVVIALVENAMGFLRTVALYASTFGIPSAPNWTDIKTLRTTHEHSTLGNVNYEVMIADYGYCLSVHKYMGSEAARVAVIDEQCDLWSPPRWRYTAMTRASKELRYFTNGEKR